MSDKELEDVLVGVLREVQSLSGRPCADLDPKSRPIGDLDGFDSLASIEATVLIESTLGCTIPQESIFISEDGSRALSISQICQRLAPLVSSTASQAR